MVEKNTKKSYRRNKIEHPKICNVIGLSNGCDSRCMIFSGI